MTPRHIFGKIDGKGIKGNKRREKALRQINEIVLINILKNCNSQRYNMPSSIDEVEAKMINVFDGQIDIEVV